MTVPVNLRGRTPLWLGGKYGGERLAYVGGYNAASRSRRQTKQWTPTPTSADGSATSSSLRDMRARSRDAIRNSAIAFGISETKVLSVVGPGITRRWNVDRKVLGLDNAAASELDSLVEREWSLYWDTPESDLERRLNGNARLRLIETQKLDNGESYVNLPRIQRGRDFPYEMRCQIIEADRVCNPHNAMDTDTLIGGIQKDPITGEPIIGHIAKFHPGDWSFRGKREWEQIPFYNRKTGLKNLIHYYSPRRAGQTHGVPDLAPILELVSVLTDYTDYEALAALISSSFTVFVTTPTGEGGMDLVTDLGAETGATSSDTDAKLGPATIIDLAEGENIEIANPARPNQSFDAFVQSLLMQMGMGVSLPVEVITKRFNSSYTAAKAAFLEAWRYYLTERSNLCEMVLDPIVENWMWEAVAKSRIKAPGFFRDPIVRRAYLRGIWVGPPRGAINEGAEVTAAKDRIAMGISTIDRETIEMNGGNWEVNHEQSAIEKAARVKDGLEESLKAPAATAPGVPVDAGGSDPDRGDGDQGDSNK